MSSTYLVLKNNNEHNASISVEASPTYKIKEFGVSDFVYLTLIVLFINLFFKGVSMLLNFLKQRWVQRRNGKDGAVDRAFNACDASMKQEQKDA
ncbi:MAG: hypothetical protein EOM50_09605 [Erysipelotrichia bacterium]|nr:hypothetical protein [Erysipelotrichia bacterium]